MVDRINERVDIAGPAGRLEGHLEALTPTPGWRAIICHPHPQFGGTMDNKVVHTLARTCRDAGAAVLRFNFRGVGRSEGCYGEALGETEDLLAADNWLAHRFPDTRLWLAGFSFGSFVAARGAAVFAAEGRPCLHLMLVAPPVHHYDFNAITDVGCGVTLVQGEEDEVVPPEEVFRWAQASPLRPEVTRFPRTGHFFHGELVELGQVVANHLPRGRSAPA